MLIGTTRITTSSINTITSTAAAAAAPTTTVKDPYTSINATVIVNIPSNSSTVDPTSQSDNNNNNTNNINNNSNDNNSKSSSVGIILALVVLVIIVFITITVVVIIVVVFWKERKSKQCTKPEKVYYSTIDEAKLQGIAKNKLEAINSETNKEEPEYMEIFKSAYSTIAGKVAVQDNPYYSIPSDHPAKTKDNLAYAISSEHQITIQAYAISFDTKQ